MSYSVFYYKLLSVKDKLHKLSLRYNQVEHVLFVEPLHISETFAYSSWFYFPKKYIFEKDKEYVAIKYKRYDTDPFFAETLSHIEFQCVRQIYPLPDIIYYRYLAFLYDTIYIDIVLCLLPKISQLKRLNITLVSVSVTTTATTATESNGIYTLTFIRSIRDNPKISNLLTSIKKDVEKYIPKVIVLFTEIYSASWFCLRNVKKY